MQVGTNAIIFLKSFALVDLFRKTTFELNFSLKNANSSSSSHNTPKQVLIEQN